MVFKKDVLVSAATMTRKERWQKSGGIRDRKRSNGVESKKNRKDCTVKSSLYSPQETERDKMLLIYENGRKKCPYEIRTQDLLYLGTAQSLFN